jgi:hypothetical protein
MITNVSLPCNKLLMMPSCSLLNLLNPKYFCSSNSRESGLLDLSLDLETRDKDFFLPFRVVVDMVFKYHQDIERIPKVINTNSDN